MASGFAVLMTEIPCPTAIRLSVSFATAVYEGTREVEGIRATCATAESWQSVLASGSVAVIVDPHALVVEVAGAVVIIDAIMSKTNTGIARRDRSVVIGLGPGFVAGRDVDAVIETMRGHELGRVIRDGSAIADTGTPGDIGGKTAERVLRAPRDGHAIHAKCIGDIVAKGDIVVRVDGEPVVALFAGCLRGLIHEKAFVQKGMKIADVDPRADVRFIHSVSDKARAVGRAALEAALSLGRERGLLRVQG